ncbi:MAG: S8 family serine peptidase, partial [Anaerolineaceae bacterium]|nr:S8 family serine peptidase [Anaerolineaceae bacterium]
MLRKLLYLFIIMVLALGVPSSAFAQDEVPPAVPATDVSGLAIPDGEVVGVPRELASASGEVQIVVRLKDEPLVLAVGQYAKKKGSKLSMAQQKAFVGKTSQNQAVLIQQVEALGGRQIARIKIALNAVIFSIDASKLNDVAKLTNVASIRPVVDYQVDLSETVPYIGASYVQDSLKVTGKGVRVAVLDSGIDYIHYNLGGSGSVDEYNANDPTIIEPGTFPTAKVVGGMDFVGSNWPNTPETPDPDPLDTGSGGGHGTHVADIIAGLSADGLHKGVAPDASLYAVKVCSSVSTACSGVALLQGMDYAMDPNGDGSINDAVDVINMSLGSSYGQREDDLSQASANAAKMGVLVVVSAGNSSDKPFVVGSPSSTPEVISVAQTQVPSAKLYVINAGSVSVGGSAQPWAAAPTLVTGPLQYGDGAGGNLNGCSAFASGSLTGKIVLVDRGVCSISVKVSNVAVGGGLAAIIANNAAQAPGDLPPDFSYGGGDPSVAGYTITRADGVQLKTVLGQSVTIDPATAASLVMNMVSSSSRGPSYSYGAIKPDIGAPGASLSAQFGTGNGQTAFGGTSGAAPMVSGAAALMVQAYPKRDPVEIKALLMNTAETNIGINPVGLPGYLAPITRIGGGEVRVDKAVMATTSAWDAADETGSLSFGFQTISLPGTTVFQKVVAVRNYTGKARTYTITPSFRYADDKASGAVKISAPKTVRVPANSMKNFIVSLKVDASKLPVWGLNGGPNGGDGYLLQTVEFDGYLTIADAKDNVHLAWQILPHRSATVSTTKNSVKLVKGAATTTLVNP